MTYDAAKDAENRAKHGISLARAEDFDFDSAYYIDDDIPNTIRAISLRKSSRKEREKYAQN